MACPIHYYLACKPDPISNKGNSGMINIESNRVQSLFFKRAVFQHSWEMYAHNNLGSEIKFLCKAERRVIKSYSNCSILLEKNFKERCG